MEGARPFVKKMKTIILNRWVLMKARLRENLFFFTFFLPTLDIGAGSLWWPCVGTCTRDGKGEKVFGFFYQHNEKE